jgi:hypothetical protein
MAHPEGLGLHIDLFWTVTPEALLGVNLNLCPGWHKTCGHPVRAPRTHVGYQILPV